MFYCDIWPLGPITFSILLIVLQYSLLLLAVCCGLKQNYEYPMKFFFVLLFQFPNLIDNKADFDLMISVVLNPAAKLYIILNFRPISACT